MCLNDCVLKCSRSAQRTLVLVLFVSATQAQTANKPLPTLTQAGQIRQLTPEQAAAGYPVRIRGVITGDVPAPDFFVQDSTAGIFVEGSHTPVFDHHFGESIEVEGVTGPGKFAPVVLEKRLRVLGKRKLPSARLYSFHELSNGQMDSQWVRVRGVIRSATIDRTSWHEMTLAMRVASEGGEFVARVPITREQDVSSWVDSEVLIEGVCGSLFTSLRQLSGVILYVPQLSSIQVEASAKEVPLSALLQFSPGQNGEHRVRVRGVVAFQQPGTALFLQSEGRGLRVLTGQETLMDQGDVVEVLGWPAVGESTPVLTDSVFHRVGHVSPQLPATFTLDAPWEEYDGSLVTLDAVLLDRQQLPGGIRLLLRTGEELFEANLRSASLQDGLLHVPLHSTVRITGICLVRNGGMWSVPQSFRILVRSASDVEVLQTASWWNLQHTLWVLGSTAGALFIVIAWVVVLGRRVREQMALIRQKLQFGAVLEERNRIARELHDSLEQGLAGITLQLDLAVDCLEQAPRVAKKALETARNMSRHSMVEARRSVWDLRCQLLEEGNLAFAMTQMVRPLAPGGEAGISVEIEGTPVRMATSIEMNLLRIGQEAVSNAINHGRAKHVTIELKYDLDNVRLRIRDNGCGFRPAERASTGHFGLLDMRERAQSMGSTLELESEPGSGTSVRVVVPIRKRAANGTVQAHTYSGG